MVALARPALADDDMGDGGGDGGGMENAGGDWGIGGMISDAINSFGNDPGGYYDPGYENGNYYDPGYQSYPSNDGSPYDPGYQSYPSPAYSGGYAPPTNRFPPQHSAGSSSSTTAPPTNPFPSHHTCDDPPPTPVAQDDPPTPTGDPQPPMTNDTPQVCQMGPNCGLPQGQTDDPPMTLNGSGCTLTDDPPQGQTDDPPMTLNGPGCTLTDDPPQGQSGRTRV